VEAAAFAPPNLSIVRGEAVRVDLEAKELEVRLLSPTTEEGGGKKERARLRFDVLVAATGAVPKRLLPPRPRGAEEEPPEDSRIVYLRDADSVAAAAASLRNARRVVVAGNGGIALGLAHALSLADSAGPEEPESAGPSLGAAAEATPSHSKAAPRRRRRRKVVWAAKHGHVGDAFFDVDAAAFLAKVIGKKGGEGEGRKGKGTLPPAPGPPASKADAPAPPSPSSPSSTTAAFGAAVGPGWVETLTGAIGRSFGREEGRDAGEGGEAAHEGGGGGGGGGGGEDEQGGLDLHLNATVTSVEDNSGSTGNGPRPPFPLLVALSDGSGPFECDAVVAAVGVRPDTSWLPPSLERSPSDGGVLVDARMRSSAGPSLLACGDACTVREGARGTRWFQMRLWSQARATGAAAGRSAAGFDEDGTFEKADDDDGGGEPPHSLELFAHATAVAGLRVILLGLYNGQGLEDEPEEDIVTFCREEEGGSGGGGGGASGGAPAPSFARALLLRGRLAGAVLIGETGLEGVFEDLILDGIDVSFLGPRLLDPDLDLEAIFD